MPKLRRFETRAETVAGDEKFWRLRALASTYGRIDSYGTAFEPGAFTKHLSRTLAKGKVGGLNHDYDRPIGVVEEVQDRTPGLVITGRITAGLAHAQEVKKLFDDGIVDSVSIGFSLYRGKYLEREDEVRQWWDTFGYVPDDDDVRRAQKSGCYVIQEAEVREYSPCLMPSNPDATVIDFRSEGGRDSLSYIDEFRAVVTALEGLTERAEDIREKRDEIGKAFGQGHLPLLRQMEDLVSRIRSASARPAEGAVLRAEAAIALAEATLIQ